MKSDEEIMEILEAFDLTMSLRDAGELAGCSHHTVGHWVAKRDAGELALGGPVRRERMIDPFMDKLEEWVERSNAKVRADVAFDKLVALGFEGSERTVRRAVAEVKANHRKGHRRVYRPWVPEPGMWAQWDWGEGPTVGGSVHEPVLCLAGLVPVPGGMVRSQVGTTPTLIGCLDRAMRAFESAWLCWRLFRLVSQAAGA